LPDIEWRCAIDDVSELPARYRLNVEDYHRMGEAGIFGDNRVELMDGELIDMAPIGQDVRDWMLAAIQSLENELALRTQTKPPIQIIVSQTVANVARMQRSGMRDCTHGLGRNWQFSPPAVPAFRYASCGLRWRLGLTTAP